MLQIMRTVGMASLLERESKCSSRLPFRVTAIAMMPGIDGCHLRKGSYNSVLVLRMAHRIWKENKQGPGTAVLLLSFVPFPVDHPEHEHCIV